MLQDPYSNCWQRLFSKHVLFSWALLDNARSRIAAAEETLYAEPRQVARTCAAVTLSHDWLELEDFAFVGRGSGCKPVVCGSEMGNTGGRQ